jgi:hypothetical protein
MKIVKCILALVIAGQAMVYACYEPANVFGVRFNAGESVDIDIITTMGEEGINYRTDTLIHLYASRDIIFRGHYDPSIMVSLSVYGMSLVVDTSVIQLEGFSVDACIRTELEWLVEAGILMMDRIAIERAEQAYAGWHLPSGVNFHSIHGPIYWTKQDTLLASSILIDEDGNFVEVDCIGSDGTVDLPPQSLLVAAVRSAGDTRHLCRNRVSTAVLKSSNRIFDINGRIMFRSRTDGRYTNRSGFLLLYNRRSGTVKKMVRLP